MNARLLRFVSVFVVIVLSGCGSGDSGDGSPAEVCPTLGYLGLVVVVTDASTGKPVEGASGTAASTVHSEQLQSARDPSGNSKNELIGLSDGAGAGDYRVTVTRNGYKDWTGVASLQMTSGHCPHVETVVLNAGLMPAP